MSLVFEEDFGTEDYFERQRIQERINGVSLPPGVQPGMDAITPPTGEIYRYTVESRLRDLGASCATSTTGWSSPPSRPVPGVIGIDPFRALFSQFQVLVDPAHAGQIQPHVEKCHRRHFPANNVNSGGSVIVRGEQSMVCFGAITRVEDLSQTSWSPKRAAHRFFVPRHRPRANGRSRTPRAFWARTTTTTGFPASTELLCGKNPSQTLLPILTGKLPS